MKLLPVLVILFLFIPFVAALPAPVGYVNDFAGVLGPDAATIDQYLTQLDKDTSAEVVVVTILELPADQDAFSYGVQLFQEWGIGKKERDNGLLILLSVKEQKWRIEIGYGLEGAITDAEAGRIGRAYLEPAFQSGQYAQGVAGAVQALEEDIRAEPIIPFAPQIQWWHIVVAVVVILIAIVLLALTGNIWVVWMVVRLISMLLSGGRGGFGGGRSGGGGAGN